MFPSIANNFIWGCLLFVAVVLAFLIYKVWNHFGDHENDDEEYNFDDYCS